MTDRARRSRRPRGWHQLPGLLEHTPVVDGRQRSRRAPVSCSTASFTHPPTAVPPPQAQMVLPPTSAPLWAQALYVADVPAQELSRPVCYRATGWSYVASHTGCCCLVAGPAEPAVAPICVTPTPHSSLSLRGAGAYGPRRPYGARAGGVASNSGRATAGAPPNSSSRIKNQRHGRMAS